MRQIKLVHTIALTCLLSNALLLGGCKKFLEIDSPQTSTNSLVVYTNDAQAAAVLTGIYGRMNDNALDFTSGRNSIGLYAGLSADEFEAYNASGSSYMQVYSYSPDLDMPGFWSQLYEQIYVCNAAIAGLNASTTVSENVKNQLLGEAKFMRAFFHFYLVNLYGDVPVVTGTDYTLNARVSRQPLATVYQQIIADLTEAKSLLSNDFLTPVGKVTTERVRPNKGAATALLARVYLYMEDWAKAESNATELITNAKYSLVTVLNNVFLMNSNEAIWQLPPVLAGINTFEANSYIRTLAPTSSEPVAVTRHVVNAFVPGDQRKASWLDSITIAAVKYYYPKKYKVKGGPATTPVTEYFMMFRLAEQYLIRAEARAKLGNLIGPNSAQTDINAIRTRAGLANTTAITQTELLAATEQERRIELFAEWGHRWFDLKRTGRANAVMNIIAPLKPAVWNSNWQLYPIPKTELDKNPNLAPQNPGYN
jgi:hypothetical protein